VETAAQRGWDKLKNGELLKAAEDAGFEVLVTPDKNIRYREACILAARCCIEIARSLLRNSRTRNRIASNAKNSSASYARMMTSNFIMNHCDILDFYFALGTLPQDGDQQ
jgi:hypothetical protein